MFFGGKIIAKSSLLYKTNQFFFVKVNFATI